MGKVVVAGVFVVVVVAMIAGAYLIARRQAHGVVPGEPDRISEDVVAKLMTELRKWQAEAEHWKSTAERLQREIDGR
jgi:uncharacterized protein YneF (UPF0154 family)